MYSTHSIPYLSGMLRAATIASVASVISGEYTVKVTERPENPSVAYIDKNSQYQQVFNPTWVEATEKTQGKSGLLIRTQDCPSDIGGE